MFAGCESETGCEEDWDVVVVVVVAAVSAVQEREEGEPVVAFLRGRVPLLLS